MSTVLDSSQGGVDIVDRRGEKVNSARSGRSEVIHSGGYWSRCSGNRGRSAIPVNTGRNDRGQQWSIVVGTSCARVR